MKTSKRKLTEQRLSPRERRLAEAVLGKGWVTSLTLCGREFGDNVKKWPLNARVLVTVAMNSVAKKLTHNGNSLRLEKVGGGRGGVSYRMR